MIVPFTITVKDSDSGIDIGHLSKLFIHLNADIDVSLPVFDLSTSRRLLTRHSHQPGLFHQQLLSHDHHSVILAYTMLIASTLTFCVIIIRIKPM